ncbi:MAG TPA: VOC family protein [Actinomycetota bacterium]|nr:VOC family protein [Actinomycetota bacterium]
MPKFWFDHVGIAVRSIKDAVALYGDALGGEFLHGGDMFDIWRWAQFTYPDGRKIELIEPLGEGFLTRFLDRYGEGLHHLTFKTDDIHAAIEHLQARGYELVDINTEHEAWKEAFVRPKSAHGTLIQIAEAKYSDEDARNWEGRPTLDELLGG